MPSIYGPKLKFQNLLRPATDTFARVGVSANQITLAAMAISFATGAAIYHFRTQRVLLLLPAILSCAWH